jgi:hypothetical protein
MDQKHPQKADPHQKSFQSRSQSENKSCLNSEMLKTIRLPKNLKNLNNGLLPQKNYYDLSENQACDTPTDGVKQQQKDA